MEHARHAMMDAISQDEIVLFLAQAMEMDITNILQQQQQQDHM